MGCAEENRQEEKLPVLKGKFPSVAERARVN
jgi:hypothetical protein